MRVRWRHPGPDLFNVVQCQDRARSEQERDARANERDRQAKARRRGGQPFDLNRKRLLELVALIEHRHGGPADTDDADFYLAAAIPHIIQTVGGAGGPCLLNRVLAWRRQYAPGATEEETLQLTADAERAAMRGDRSAMRADSMAKLLRLTNAERSALGITTIGGIDRTRKQREADRKQKARERARKWRDAKRTAEGKTPRQETVTAEAKHAGVARSTIYRRRQRATLSYATPTDTYEAGATLSYAPVRSTTGEFGGVAPSEKRTSERAAIQGSSRRSVGAGVPSHGVSPIQVEASRSVATGHSGGGRDDPRDFIGDLEPALEVLGDYARDGGIMPTAVVRATREAKRLRDMRQDDVARAIGLSRPQLANALQGRFGLSKRAAASLREWLTA